MPENIALYWPSWKKTLAAHAETGALPSDFSQAPKVLALVEDPHVAEKTFRRGAIIIEAGTNAVTAWLVFQGRIFGVYGQKNRDADAVLRDMAEFRLGWLPDEAVQNQGGFGSAFAFIPSEAEGFPMIFIAGENRGAYTGKGKLVPDPAS